MVASGCRRFDDAFAATTAGRLGPVACGRLEGLLSRPKVLAGLKSDPGPLGLDTLLAEIGKLSTVRALGLDEAVFGGASDRIVAAWRARAARMYPSDFGDCPEPVRYALLGALCWTRQAELVDSLVEPLIGLIHRINARAERRVEKELIGELANVPGKRGIFTRIIDAALAHPDDTVRDAVYPVVPGGVSLATTPVSATSARRPATYVQLFQASAAIYCPGLPWTVLAAIGQIESADGINEGPSTAGALGPMQFLPSTGAEWGISTPWAPGPPDVINPFDAVPSAARYLCAAGGATAAGLPGAIFAYNHANWYVTEVLALAKQYAQTHG